MKKIKVKNINTKDYLNISKLQGIDYVINPYVGCMHKCIYCYAEFMKRFTNHYEPWGDFTDIKVCDKKIDLNKIKGKTILISSVTDAYNPLELKYEVTKNILEQLIGCDAKIEILTKSSIVLRDIEILKKIPNIKVGISMNTIDDNFRKEIEPYTSSVDKRINTLKVLKENKIETYLFMSPIFPGITDFKKIIEKTKNYVDTYYFENLNLRGDYFKRVLNYINNNYSELNKLYKDIYVNNNLIFLKDLKNGIEEYCIKNNIKYNIVFHYNKNDI